MAPVVTVALTACGIGDYQPEKNGWVAEATSPRASQGSWSDKMLQAVGDTILWQRLGIAPVSATSAPSETSVAGAPSTAGPTGLWLCLAAAADYSPIYPTDAVPLNIGELTFVFRVPSDSASSKMVATLFALEGVDSARESEILRLEVPLAGADRGELHITVPPDLHPGPFRLETSIDRVNLSSIDFEIVPGRRDSSALGPKDLMTLETGTRWTYAFVQYPGNGVSLELPHAILGPDGIARAEAKVSITRIEEPGARVDFSRRGHLVAQQWWATREDGVVITRVTAADSLIDLEPPRPFFPLPLALPREWEYLAADGSWKEKYRMWGPVPIRGPAGVAPGYVVLAREEGQAVTTTERHFLPGVGMVKEVIIVAIDGQMVSRQEMDLLGVEPGAGEKGEEGP